MTEQETKPLEKEEVKKEPVKEEVSEIQSEDQEVETEARRMGWVPKEEYQGDKRRWIDAKRWVERAPIQDELTKLRRESRELKSTINDLKQHHQRVEETAYQRAIDQLKQEKLTALEAGDHKRVIEVDDEIDKIRENRAIPRTGPASNPEFNRFVDSNPWYETDSRMREFADFVGIRYAQENPSAPNTEVFEYAAKRVKEQYPEHFGNQRRQAASPVEGAKPTQSRSRRPNWSDLPDINKQAGDRFVKQGIMTREQYIDELIRIGEIKV